MKKHVYIFTALIAAIALSAGAWHFFAPETSAVVTSSSFVTAPVTRGDIEDVVLASGVLKASEQVDVGAQVSGQIQSLKVKLGQTVKKGDIIAEIDSETQRNEIKDAEAALDSMKAQRVAKLASLKQSEQNYNRLQTLLAADSVSRESFEGAEASYAGVKAELETLNAQIRQAEITADKAKVNLKYTQIVAPIDGVVVSIPTKEGQTVNASQSTPTIVSIARLDKMAVKVKISEADISRVREGQDVYFTIFGQAAKKYHAKLDTIEPVPDGAAEGNNGGAIYYNGLFIVDNTDGALRIAMTAEVSIVLASAQNVVLVPAAALGAAQPDGSYAVDVIENGVKARRNVKIGINNNINAEVISGLAEGDVVVTGSLPATAPPESM